MTREEYFCENYLDKLYYFYLKKTGNSEDAGDLANETALEILKALAKGITPDNFSAWVWTIAKNRYARWADKKHIRLENEETAEIENLDITSKDSLEDIVVQNELINELRRELSLIEKEFREIIVAYYIDNNSISEISGNLSIPEGTVKTKLFKGRQRLKEGMSMARTFGKLSYAPEDINIHQSGGRGSYGEPDIYIDDDLHGKICKNILIEAYRNPVTIQELSIELGIAMPYLEPFVERMTDSTLLIKTGSKPDTATYETNFVIISSDSWRKMNDKLFSIQKDFVTTAKEYLEKSRKLQLDNGNYILGKYQDYEEQKWTLALRLADDIQWALYDKRNLQFNYDTVRPNGGSWDILGVQEYDGPRFMWIGHSVSFRTSSEDSIIINAFYTERNLETDKLSIVYYENTSLIDLIVKGQSDKLSEFEIESLLKKGFIKKIDNEYVANLGIYSKEHNSETLRYAIPIDIYNKELLSLWDRLMELAEEYIVHCENVMHKEVPERLNSQFNFCMHSIPFLRGMVVEGLLQEGFLKPENELSKMIGVYTCI